MKFVCVLFTLVAPAAAQILSAPEPVYAATSTPGGLGNGCSYRASMLICTGTTGSVTAFEPPATDAKWTYIPAGGETSSETSSSSGVVFGLDFLITSVTLDAAMCRVDAINTTDGSLQWSSSLLDGACSGSPLLSSDDAYVFLTHNPADGPPNFIGIKGLTGRFSVISVAAPDAPFYTFVDDSEPLSPPGIYHNPVSGNYAGGAFNMNDVVVFANTPSPREDRAGVTPGNSYVFQFPLGFMGSIDAVMVTTLLEDNDWKATVPPLLIEGGQKMIWGVSRGNVLFWIDAREFSQDVGIFQLALGRGNPPSLPVTAEIVTDSMESILYSSSAGNAFVAIDPKDPLSGPLWVVNTTSPVYAKPIVALDDLAVFVLEQSGFVRAISPNGTIIFSVHLTVATLLASATLSPAGDVLYFVDSGGFLFGFKIVESGILDPTMAPVPVPATMAPVSDVVPTAGTGDDDDDDSGGGGDDDDADDESGKGKKGGDDDDDDDDYDDNFGS